MESIQFDNQSNYGLFGQYDEDINHSFDQWSGALQLDAGISIAANGVDNIEHIYTGLHKSVDQVVATITSQTPPQLEQIREQNRRVFDKLASLENNMIGSSTAVVYGLRSPVSRSASTSEIDRVSPPHGKRRHIVKSPGNATAIEPIPSTPNRVRSCSIAPNLPESHNFNGLSSSLEIQLDSNRHPSLGRLEGNPKLARKFLQIGNQEAKAQVAEFSEQLKARGRQIPLPNIYKFSNVSQITNGPDFLQLLLNLGLTIESSIFWEQNYKVKKRIALAHFYRAYTIAQDNPEMFLSWCDDRQMQGSMLPKGGYRSVVQHRFADLMFPRAEKHGRTYSASSLQNGEDLKKRIGKIQVWRKNGKQWEKMIKRFGCGILLLLPSNLSDEDLRVAHDEDVASGLDLIDSRKHLFADVLYQANVLLNAHFFPQDENARPAHVSDSGVFEGVDWSTVDWDGLLSPTILSK